MARPDLTGKVFNKLTVISAAEDYVSPKNRRQARWNCLCQCGNIVTSTSSNLNQDKIFSCGCEKRNKDKVAGIGIYDGKPFASNNTPLEYKYWHNMLHRCGNVSIKEKYNTYENAYCVKDWEYFSGFKDWFSRQVHDQGYQLDKDILIPGNKIYSPDTCALIPYWLNTCFVTCFKKKDLPLGVTLSSYKAKDPSKQKYVARLGGDFLGDSLNAEDCHKMWQRAKILQIEDYAERYKLEKGYRKDIFDAIIYRRDLVKEELLKNLETVKI